MPMERSPRPGANGLFAKRWPDNGCAWNASRGSCWSAIDTCTFGKSIYKAEPHTLLWWRAAPPPERAAPVGLRAPSATLSGPQNRNKGKTQSVKDVLATPVSHVLATYTLGWPVWFIRRADCQEGALALLAGRAEARPLHRGTYIEAPA